MFGDAAVPHASAERIDASLARGRGPTQRSAHRSLFMCSRTLGGQYALREGEQPHVTRNAVVAFDGRLDERSALSAELGLPAEQTSDVALVAAAHARWGGDCVRHLHGEWSLAIYEPAAGVLTLATDFSGAAPLYYAVLSDRVVWSSELATTASETGGRIDSKYLLGFILNVPELGLTPFEGVKAVHPGYAVTVVNGTAAERVGWAPDLTTTLRYSSDHEYEEHFRHVFRRVIEDRLAVPGPVWAELSGGLDSSTNVCIAHDILRGSAPADKLRAVFYRFEGGNSDEDARAAEAVVDATNCRFTVLDAHSHPYLCTSPGVPLPTGIAGVVPAVARLVEESGGRMLISGEGGDGLMCDGRGWPCASIVERVARGRIPAALREASAFGRWTNRSVWDVLWNDVVGARRWREPDFMWPTAAPWVDAQQVAAYREWARAQRRRSEWAGASATAALSYQYVNVARRCAAAQPDRLTGALDVSYPYLDRRLVQFMLSVPFDQKVRPGMGRSLQRRALQGILPDAVRLRTRKSSGRGPLMRALQSEWARIDPLLSPDGRLASMGLVDAGRLRAAADTARSGRTANVGAIWRAVAAELWLRTSETGAVA